MEFLKDKLGAEDYLLPFILFFFEFFFGLKMPQFRSHDEIEKKSLFDWRSGAGGQKNEKKHGLKQLKMA